jgi:hypothetical protein
MLRQQAATSPLSPAGLDRAGVRKLVPSARASGTPIGPAAIPVHSPCEDLFSRWDIVRLSAVSLSQIYVSSRPKHSALPGAYVGRYGPIAQRDIEGIDSQSGPKSQLADPVLFRVASRTQRNGVAIARLHPCNALGAHARLLIAPLVSPSDASVARSANPFGKNRPNGELSAK